MNGVSYIEWAEFMAQYNIVLPYEFNCTVKVINAELIPTNHGLFIGSNEIIAAVIENNVGLFIGRSLVWHNTNYDWFNGLQNYNLI